MKGRLRSYVLLFFTVLFSFCTTLVSAKELTVIPADWPQPPAIQSEAAIVMELSTGTILYEKNATQTMYPASTTKLMTALLTFQYANLSDTITFSSKAILSLIPGSSHIGMKIGEQLSVEDCLYGLLLPSANETANALAEYVSGSISDFVKRMNETAAELGCINTQFENPNGLHSANHYTCAYDLAIIMRECLQYEDFIRIDSTPAYVRQADDLLDRDIPMGTTNKMIRKESDFYTPEVICGKTGWTAESGRCLVTYASLNGMEIICVTMNAEDPNQFKDTQLLLNYSFNGFNLLRASEQDMQLRSTGQSAASPLGLKSTAKAALEVDPASQIIVPSGKTFQDVDYSVITDEITGKTNIFYEYMGYPVGSSYLVDSTGLYTADLYLEIPPRFVSIDYQPLKTRNLLIYGGITLAVVLVIAIIIFAIRSQDIQARNERRAAKKRKGK